MPFPEFSVRRKMQKLVLLFIFPINIAIAKVQYLQCLKGVKK